MPGYDPEHSEAVLYHIRILEELDENEEALQLLDVSAKERVVVDRVTIMEMRGALPFLAYHSDAYADWTDALQRACSPNCPTRNMARTRPGVRSFLTIQIITSIIVGF